MGTKTRIAKWDNIKFVLILLVVIGHALRSYTDTSLGAQRVCFYIYLFHMPAFLFISGLVSKGTVDNKRYDKVFSYFILFLLMKFTRYLIIPRKTKMFTLWEIEDISWYALALLVYCLVTMLCRQFSVAYMMVMSILIACCIGYAKDMGAFLSLERIFAFYPFFLAGYYIDGKKLLERTKHVAVKVSAAVIFVVSVAIVYFKIEKIFWLMDFLRQKDSYKVVLKSMKNFGFLYRLGWYGIAFLLIFVIVVLVPSIDCFISRMGQRTVAVYALHYTVLLYLFNEWEMDSWVCTSDGVVNVKLLLFIAVVITCVLSLKPVAFVVDTIISPKRRRIQ